jgi:hypothetical protein
MSRRRSHRRKLCFCSILGCLVGTRLNPILGKHRGCWAWSYAITVFLGQSQAIKWHRSKSPRTIWSFRPFPFLYRMWSERMSPPPLRVLYRGGIFDKWPKLPFIVIGRRGAMVKLGLLAHEGYVDESLRPWGAMVKLVQLGTYWASSFMVSSTLSCISCLVFFTCWPFQDRGSLLSCSWLDFCPCRRLVGLGSL